MVLDIAKNLQGGFTQAMQQLADTRKQHAELVQTVEEYGADTAVLRDLLEKGKTFAEDPQRVISQLAAQAGVEVFFERPPAAGEIPEFQSAEDMALWVQKQVSEKLAAERKAADEQTAQERKRGEARDALKRELDTAATELPDFGDHKQAVFEALAKAPGLSVSEAYRLSTWDGLKQLAEEGQAAQRELAAMKAEKEAAAKAVTNIPAGRRGNETVKLEDLSPGQRALTKARGRISKRQAAGA